MTHGPDTADYWREQERHLVEATASGATIDVRQLGLARAELIRRDREYAEQQERARRKFEMDRDSDRENHKLKMFDEAGLREIARQKFEEELARRQMEHASALAKEQMEHASALAKEQLDTAQATSRTALWAAMAAGLSALGAISQALIAALK